MRIIGGQWKRTRLPVAERPGLRPTPDRVRETLFNWLGQDLTGWRCLDAFAGTGALGFECASRGAASVLLVEGDAGLVRQLELLRQRLQATAVRVQRDDGVAALRQCAPASMQLLLIDPPFEKPDDYIRSAETALAVIRRDPAATIAVWTPLKDLETFDAFTRRLEGRAGPTLVAEARLRPLTNPMKMNGCTMTVLNPPSGAEAAAAEICGWVATTLGEAGARAEIWRAG